MEEKKMPFPLDQIEFVVFKMKNFLIFQEIFVLANYLNVQ
jgi:hypothetical protein